MGDECNISSQRVEDVGSFSRKDLKKCEKELSNKKHVREIPSGEPGEDILGIPEVSQAQNFSETKLRPDAPPFTPECVTPVGGISYREPDVEGTCFVNVDLRTQDDHSIPEPEGLNLTQSSKEIKDPALKPFSLTSTPLLKKHVPKVQVPTVEEEDAVISIPTNELPSSEVMTLPASGQSRNFATAFLLRNRIQIAVIMASMVICAVLFVYVIF